MADISINLQQSVKDAFENQLPLQIIGGNTKAFYGRKTQGHSVFTSNHQGIVSYEPTELVITARCGTPITQIESALAEKNQMLGFEPPHFGENATIGGVVASGLSGPRRPFAGAVRDLILGCQILNGKAEILSFGGQVMKNVAGYDISRLMAGALGTLGILLEISLKVLPTPIIERTLSFELKREKALDTMHKWCGQPLPLSALCFDGNQIFARLSGAEGALASARNRIGGEWISGSRRFWKDVGELTSPFFKQTGDLWRLSLPPAAPQPKLSGHWFLDWGGAQRWLLTFSDPDEVFSVAAQLSGHATLFRNSDPLAEKFQPQTAKLMDIHKNLKQAFDPANILNPGRLYSTL